MQMVTASTDHSLDSLRLAYPTLGCKDHLTEVAWCLDEARIYSMYKRYNVSRAKHAAMKGGISHANQVILVYHGVRGFRTQPRARRSEWWVLGRRIRLAARDLLYRLLRRGFPWAGRTGRADLFKGLLPRRRQTNKQKKWRKRLATEQGGVPRNIW